MPRSLITLSLLLLANIAHTAEPITLLEGMKHLRQADPREWNSFPEAAESKSLHVKFNATRNASEWTLRLRQENVKEAWEITLNGKRLTLLTRDENSMVVCTAIPGGACVDGENDLIISTKSTKPDDIRVGGIRIVPQPRTEVLTRGRLSVRVIGSATRTPLPCRLTVLDQTGAQHDVGAATDATHAVRGGVIYCTDGTASFGLPAGRFQLVAGRGPEYGIATRELRVTSGEQYEYILELERQVDTTGWISCDPHVHTLTHSGHGDATIQERLITLAGENIELPVATDHNKQIDYRDLQREMGLSPYFTPVVGNEVTTKVGHFNIFPAPPDGPVPDHNFATWEAIFQSIHTTAKPAIIILNHPRDLHSNYRPFGLRHRHPLTGRQLDGWQLEANAMEVVNSGAQQSDMMQLPHDWMVNLNRGLILTQVGSSDSHDVARHFVGQGRTFIRCDDTDPGNIDVTDAIQSFREGRVVVSCGLFPVLTVDDRYGPGDLIPRSENRRLKLQAEVRSADWIEPASYVIFLNDGLVALEDQNGGEIEVPSHDCHLVLVATAPGVVSLHWPVARPYQPTSEEWTPLMFGMTGAVWYDGNGDGKRNSAHEIAHTLWKDSAKDPAKFITALGKTHRSVCLQGAELLHLAGIDLNSPETRQQLQTVDQYVQSAFNDYLEAWRHTEIARAQGEE